MNGSALHKRYDVIVAGTRCAGAAVAMLLARKGIRVLAIDPRRPGSDTLSTHALMRGAVLQLSRWGVLDAVRDRGTPPIRSTTFHYGDETIEVQIKPRAGVDALYAPRRSLLDSLLAAEAEKAGADVRYGASLTDLVRDGTGRVRGAAIRTQDGSIIRIDAELVVGADGLRSRVARLIDAPVERAAAHATASIYGYWPGDWGKGFQWYYRPGVSTGTIPTNDDRTCVFVSMPADRFRRTLGTGLEVLHRSVLLEAAPELSDAVRRTPLSKLRAFAGQPGFLKRAYGRGWALVGDAGYFRDPLTAHGITDALRDAELLAHTVAEGGELREYQAARDAVAKDLLETTDRIASFEWDLEAVKELHLAFSRHMAAGVDLVSGFDADTRAVA